MAITFVDTEQRCYCVLASVLSLACCKYFAYGVLMVNAFAAVTPIGPVLSVCKMLASLTYDRSLAGL